MALSTNKQAKDHLLIDYDDRDADLALKMQRAEETVVDYRKKPNHGWKEGTVPKTVQTAILLVLTALSDDRDGSGEGDYFALGGPVARLLARHRDPAIA